jgi:hypothetical protein
VTERLKSGVAQEPGGKLLCAVSDCTWAAPPGDCVCVHHALARDARTDAMRQLAVAGGFEAPTTTTPAQLVLLGRIVDALEKPIPVPPGATGLPFHPTTHALMEREVAALERIAAALEKRETK